MPVMYCIKKETYEQAGWLRDIFKLKPGENCETGIYVSDGTLPSDGIAEVQQLPLEKTTIIRDDGAVYENLSDLDVQRLYLGTYSGKPTRSIDAAQSREFIGDMLSNTALSKSGRSEFCKSNKCENPKSDPWFYAEHGDCSRAEKLLKEDTDRFYATNNLAWFYATAKEPEFKRPKEAIKLAKEAIRLQENELGEGKNDKIMVGAFYHTLAMAYYVAGNYDKALETIKYVENDYSPTACRALKELILEKKLPGLTRWSIQFVSDVM